MQDDILGSRIVIAAFVELVAVAALVVGLMVIVIGPSSSADASTRRTTHHPGAHPVPLKRTPLPAVPHPNASPIRKVDWTPAVKSVVVILSEGTNLEATLTEEVPSAAAFRAACSKLARQPAPKPPLGSGGAQLSSLEAVASDASALVDDCETTINDSESNPSGAAASANGQIIGQDLAALRSDAANFYVTIGYSGGDQTSDASGLSVWTLAREIGFQQSDFPPGTIGVSDSPGGPDETTPVPASTPCSPLHSQPFVADYDSQAYDPSGIGEDGIYSEVLIMPAADAGAALRAISAPGYDSACFQPAYDANTQSFVPSSSCGSFDFLGSTISPLPVTGFPKDSIGYRYIAHTMCTEDGQNDTWYADVISTHVGSAFIQGNFNSSQVTVSTQVEQKTMNAMATRAHRLQAGSA